MIRRPINSWAHALLGVASICVVVGLYSWLSHQQHQRNPQDTTIPNGAQFAEGLKKITTPSANKADDGADGTWQRIGRTWIYEDATASLWRLFLGMGTGVVISFVIGIGMGCFTPIEAFLLPPVAFLAKIPPTAMLAVYFVVFGTDLKLFVAMIAFGVFPTLAQAIYQAAKKDVSEHAIYKAYTLGASQFEVIWEVVIQQILPRIIEAIRLQIGPAMVFLIAAEWMMADAGFGYRLRIQSRLLNMNVVYTYLILLGVGGFVMDWMLSSLRRWWCPWFGE